MFSFQMIFKWIYLQAMVAHGRVELLAHPLSQKYLQMKWNAYGKYFHVTNLLIYTVFLSFVTLYASQLMQSVDVYNNHDNSTDPSNTTEHNSTAEVRNIFFIEIKKSSTFLFLFFIIN